jgi:rhodanese-related sulfurtransferase
VPVAAQILRLCAVTAAGSAVLIGVRGLPQPPAGEAITDAAACQAPEPDAFDPHPEVRWISQEGARHLVGEPGVAFVDCRARDQFEAGHVSGSLHLDAQGERVPATLLRGLAQATTVITYCEAAGGECQRSLEMAGLLRAAGVPDVRVLEGGMPAWLEHGYPAESGTCRHCEAAR